MEQYRHTPCVVHALQAQIDGKTYTLSKELKGRWLVLAWFPKAYTGG